MSIFGVIMILAAIQLFVVGSIIQRGRAALIPDFLIKNIQQDKMFWYCRAFGNRLILLCLVALVCGVMSLMSKVISLTPILIFGAGLFLVVIMLLLDHKKYKVK